MQRRKFVTQAAGSLIGFHLTNGLPGQTALPSKAKLYTWFDQYLRLTSISSCSLFRQADLKLESTISVIENSFLNPVYDRKKINPLYYSDGHNCIVPFELHQQEVSDLYVCFFEKNSAGDWRSFTRINGFELEALVEAGIDLEKQGIIARPHLLPLGRTITKNEKFSTAKGSVNIKTNLGSVSSLTHITIHHGNEIILSKQFQSQHCLTAGVQMIS